MGNDLPRFSPALSAIGGCLLETSPDCVEILDLQGNLIFLNRSGAALREIENTEEFYSKPWLDFWPPHTHAMIAGVLERTRSGTVSRFVEMGYATQTATAKWWDVVISPVKDESGALTHIMAISRDVTARKATEAALEASAKQFRALADNINQLAWMGDSEGSIFWYNQRWFDYTGTTLDEMAGWGWRKAHHPDHVDRVVQKVSACFQSGEDWEDLFPLRGADGEYRWFLSRARPIRDDAGRVVLWCGTNTDVTNERNYRLRLDQKARLIDLSREAILVRDMDSKIELWNNGCVDLYGFSREEAAAAFKLEDLLQTKYLIPREEIDKALHESGAWSGELLQYAKDGSAVWVESRQQLLRVDGRCVVLESNRDITERRAADEIRDLLLAELNHRVKNTLAIVQAVASQTARRSTNFHQFLIDFNGRLQSLSSAHNLLTEAEWFGVDLRTLIEEQVLPVVSKRQNIVVSGEAAILPAQSAIQLGLILHELTTNAQKYGALSTPKGKVDISWEVDRGSRPHVNLVWRELGGPGVKAPKSTGFGTTLIDRSRNLAYLNVQLKFEPCGVVCQMSIDLPQQVFGEHPYFNPRKRGDGGSRDQYKES